MILLGYIARLFRLPNEQARLMQTIGFWWGVALILSCLVASVAIQYSANNDWFPWAWSHAWRGLVGILVIVSVIMVPLPVWFRYAYLFYGINLFLLMLIPIFGISNMGAQRWFAFGSLFIQPSEPMKIFTIMALARYFHSLDFREVGMMRYLIPAIVLALMPVGLTMIQPDLGTAISILIGGGLVFFLAGVRWWKFVAVLAAVAISMPLIWQYILHEFQRMRIRSFLNPENDLLGSGYQLMQSKIAIGAGGLFGQGWQSGTQSRLGFIPAKHTDFVFALYAEQFGFVGSMGLIILLFLLLVFGLQCASVSRSVYGRIVVLSMTMLWIIQSIINLSMVMGLLPVVGIPLPFFSYGGTSLWTTLSSFGLILNIYLYQYTTLRKGVEAL